MKRYIIVFFSGALGLAACGKAPQVGDECEYRSLGENVVVTCENETMDDLNDVAPSPAQDHLTPSESCTSDAGRVLLPDGSCMYDCEEGDMMLPDDAYMPVSRSCNCIRTGPEGASYLELITVSVQQTRYKESSEPGGICLVVPADVLSCDELCGS